MLPSPTNGIVFKIPQTHKYNDSTGKEHTAYHIHFTVDGGEEQMVMRSVENFRFFDSTVAQPMFPRRTGYALA